MANKFPARGDFSVPDAVFDSHEWAVDFLIDGPTGQNATLIYPPKPTQCDNCKLSPDTGRSSGIYNGTGPISFTNFTRCPRCGGVGRLEAEQTNSDTVRLRTYWNPKDWIDIGIRLAAGETGIMTIGYMTDLPKIEQATNILIKKDLQNIRRYRCERIGEAVPHGFRQNRYFIQFLKRLGGG